MNTRPESETSARSAGLLGAAAAYLMWGVLPIYWKTLIEVPALELICHRVVWCMLSLALILSLQRRWRAVRDLAAQRATLALLVLSATLVALNWFVYVWAVNNDHVVEGSLGYYINPLVNVLLGFVFFRDRLDRMQSLAILLAATGVGVSVVHYGSPPWIALTLAFSFGTYGLVRKVARVDPIPGLFVETLLLSLPAAGYIVWREASGAGAFSILDAARIHMLFGAGVVTALPLLCFAFAVRRLRLVTMGVMQYTAPTCMLLIGVLLYGEPFGTARLVTFCFIWSAVALYVLDGVLLYRRERQLLANRNNS